MYTGPDLIDPMFLLYRITDPSIRSMVLLAKNLKFIIFVVKVSPCVWSQGNALVLRAVIPQSGVVACCWSCHADEHIAHEIHVVRTSPKLEGDQNMRDLLRRQRPRNRDTYVVIYCYACQGGAHN